MIKGIQNNLIEHDAVFYDKNEKKECTASWKDVISFYETESSDSDYKICPKITDSHVYSAKLKKMKVKMATQIFSRSFSAGMRFANKAGTKFTYLHIPNLIHVNF